jgi:hypothetical protein
LNEKIRERIAQVTKERIELALHGQIAIDFQSWILARKHIWSGAHNARSKKGAKK